MRSSSIFLVKPAAIAAGPARPLLPLVLRRTAAVDMSGSAVLVSVTSEHAAWPVAVANPDLAAGGEVGDGPQGGLTGVVIAAASTAVAVSPLRVLVRSANGSGATTGAGAPNSTVRSDPRVCAPTLLVSTDLALVNGSAAEPLPRLSAPRSCWCAGAVSASASMTDERVDALPASQLLHCRSPR